MGNLKYKKQCLKEYKNAYTDIFYNNVKKSLNDYFSDGTYYYFEQYFEGIADDLFEILGDAKINEDQDNIDHYTKVFEEFTTKSLNDWSIETTREILINLEYYAKEWLAEDIKELKADKKAKKADKKAKKAA